MAQYLDSRYGRIRPLKNNPRKISDGAFTKLCASIARDPEFMALHPIIINEQNEILGGNQRQYALLSFIENGWPAETEEILRSHADEDWSVILTGYLPDSWVKRLHRRPGMSDEEWERQKQRLVLIDNSPEGMAGEFDYDILGASFSIDVMKESGIDFAGLDKGIQDKGYDTAEDEAEKSDYGEKDERLAKFVENREAAREQLDEMTDVQFYLCAIFQNHEQVKAFLDATKLASDGEMFVSGLALAEKFGVKLARADYKFPTARTDAGLVEMAMENEEEPRGASAEANDAAANE